MQRSSVLLRVAGGRKAVVFLHAAENKSKGVVQGCLVLLLMMLTYDDQAAVFRCLISLSSSELVNSIQNPREMERYARARSAIFKCVLRGSDEAW